MEPPSLSVSASSLSPLRESANHDDPEPADPEPADPEPADPEPADPEPADTLHLYSKHRHAWVRSRPSIHAPWIGFLGLGSAVPLPDDQPPLQGPGCNAFQPIVPRGYVCLDDRVSLNPFHPALTAVRAIAPDRGSPWPHHYAESRHAPRYRSLPEPQLQKRREFQLEQHLNTVAALRDGTFEGVIPRLLKDVDVSPSGASVPGYLAIMPHVQEELRTLQAGSTISYAQQFDAHGRTWVVTGDGAIVPKDRIAPYAISTFEGAVISDSNPLPLAFVQQQPRPQFVRRADGTIVLRGRNWPRHASFGLSGEQVEQDGEVFVETRDGSWANRKHITEVRASPVTPWGDKLTGEGIASKGLASKVRWHHRGAVPPPGEKRSWIEISVHEGWLIAYEGARPVRATLVATGRGEPVAPGSKSLQTSTPPGIFAIQGKFWTSTMAVNSTAHFDVPFVIPYAGAYALHAAYWHDRWGEKVSLGCVNLSPIDARWLFFWAEPSIPAGWHGMRATPDLGHSTVVVVHA